MQGAVDAEAEAKRRKGGGDLLICFRQTDRNTLAALDTQTKYFIIRHTEHTNIHYAPGES